MSLPSTTPKPSQLSIKSFFQPRQPNYAPPPSLPKNATENPHSETNAPPPVATLAASPENPLSQSRIARGPPASSTLLPRQAAIRNITERDIQPLRRINALLLPVAYPDSFYAQVLDPAISGTYSRVITWADPREEPKVVGGVVCCIQPSPSESVYGSDTKEHALYIRSLCLLSPYRSFGMAALAVDEIVAAAVADPDLNVRSVFAHVWTANDEGMRWYTARGFTRYGEPKFGYYLKLRPDTAWIVRRELVLPTIRSSLPTSHPASTRTSSPPLSTTAAVANLPSMTGPPMGARPDLPSRTASELSFQNKRAEMEWNDLPSDMAPGKLAPPKSNGGSEASSRSSSMARKKKERAYPAAAFGS